MYIIFVVSCLLWFVNVCCGCMAPIMVAVRFMAAASALCIVIKVLLMLMFRRMNLDRVIAGSRMYSLILIMLTICAVPVGVYAVSRLFFDDVTPYELVYSPDIYYDDESDVVRYQTLRNDTDTLVLKCIADNRYADGIAKERSKESVKSPSLMWTIMYHFFDPGNQHMTTSHQGRIWAFVIALLGVTLMSGILVASITNLFTRRADEWMRGECRYYPSVIGRKKTKGKCVRLFFGKYAIIIGGHNSLVDICHSIQDKVDNIFVITAKDITALRGEFMSDNDIDEDKIVLYRGDITNINEIDVLYPQHAEKIYIIGEDDVTSDHDIQVMKCLQIIADKAEAEKWKCETPKKCYVQFEYQTTFSVIQSAKTPGIIKKVIEFLPYNYYENWAQKVLITDATPDVVDEKKDVQLERYKNLSKKYPHQYKYHPLDGKGIGVGSEKRVHLVIVGMSKMGVALAIEAAHIAHYPNFVDNHDLRTRITFIDTEADTEKDFFMGRFEQLFGLSRWRYMEGDNVKEETPWDRDPEGNYLDIEWEFIKGGVEAQNVKDYLRKCACNARKENDNGTILTVAVCLENEHESVAATLYLPKEVYINAQQVLVYQKSGCSIIDNVNGFNLFAQKDNEKGEDYFAKMRYKKLLPFGMQTYNNHSMDSMDNMQQLANSASRVYDSFNDKDFNTPDVIGFIEKYCDNAKSAECLKKWAESEIWRKWSNIYNVNSLDTKMRSIRESVGLCEDKSNPFGKLLKDIIGVNKGKINIISDKESKKPMSYVINEPGVKEISREASLRDRQLCLLRYMTEVEKNRWNIEKLLMGYRPITEEEESLDIEQVKKLKDTVKRAHYCIRSYDSLVRWDQKHPDSDMVGFDVAFSLILPYLENLKLRVEN